MEVTHAYSVWTEYVDRAVDRGSGIKKVPNCVIPQLGAARSWAVKSKMHVSISVAHLTHVLVSAYTFIGCDHNIYICLTTVDASWQQISK